MAVSSLARGSSVHFQRFAIFSMVSMVTRNFGVRRCAKTKTVVGLHVLSALVTLRIYVVLNLSSAT